MHLHFFISTSHMCEARTQSNTHTKVFLLIDTSAGLVAPSPRSGTQSGRPGNSPTPAWNTSPGRRASQIYTLWSRTGQMSRPDNGASGVGGKRTCRQLTPSAAETRSSKFKVPGPKSSAATHKMDESLSKDHTPAATPEALMPRDKPLKLQCPTRPNVLREPPRALTSQRLMIRQLAEQMRLVITTASDHDEPTGPCMPSSLSSHCRSSAESSCPPSTAPRLGIEEVEQLLLEGCKLVYTLAHELHAKHMLVSMRTIMHAMLLVSARCVLCVCVRDKCKTIARFNA